MTHAWRFSGAIRMLLLLYCCVDECSVWVRRPGLVESTVWRHQWSVPVSWERGHWVAADPQWDRGRHALLAVCVWLLRSGVW